MPTQNQEDYLETLYVLTRDRKVARVKDVARMLNIQMPSVSAALKNLGKMGYLKHDNYGYIELTPEGEKVGGKVRETHLMLYDFLNRVLKVPAKAAEEDACRMEHALSPETIKRLIPFIEALRRSPDILEGKTFGNRKEPRKKAKPR
jgi:DtxR family Mn-dependent transcriptional regulator